MKPRDSIAVIVTIFLGCARPAADLPFFHDANMTPEWLSDAEASAPTMHHVAAFRATDQHGATVTERALDGKVTIAHFFYTKCGDVCPITTRHLQHVLDSLHDEKRLQVLSYSIRADRDAVADLAEFADARGVSDARWHLLTGDRAAIDSLARHSFFVRLGDGSTFGVKSIAHTESVILVDGRGRLRGVYAGTLPLEMQRLREDVEALLRSLEQ